VIATSVGWTTGGSPGHLDPVESDITNLGPDEVLVRIDGHQANLADFDKNCDGEHTAQGSQEVCRGVGGRVIEAGVNALWYVDRCVIVPAGSVCATCDAGQRERATIRSDEEVSKSEQGGTPAKFVVARAHELCVVSVTVDWRKPIST
jgi:hypothetical protein